MKKIEKAFALLLDVGFIAMTVGLAVYIYIHRSELHKLNNPIGWGFGLMEIGLIVIWVGIQVTLQRKKRRDKIIAALPRA